MRVLLIGKNAKNIEKLIKDLGFEIVTLNPDLIITYGGDGTLLSAESQFPLIPKLPIRDSDICKKCVDHQDEDVLKKLIKGELKIKEYKKLETEILFKKFYALNDFVVRNFSPTHAIRFKVNGRFSIGDGIVISTPFGSTAYFRSVTGQTFEKGFSMAFNNTTEQIDPLFLKDGDTLTFQLTRGKATLSFDNSLDIFNIDEGSQLLFKLSDHVAKIYEDTSLRCPNCEVIRG
ncbi:hypothetical protein HYS92_00720 [Candidatus Daviesbacteria bacterium]|nr:hypothetical protein [Candidatus Daviesbacteria bacterium]